MASFRHSLPPPSHFGFQHSSVHRPGLLRVLPHAEPFQKSELPWQPRAVTMPRTKPLGELVKENAIREKLLNPELPLPSSYDTAWVAMVPAPGCPQASRFPKCVDWIMQNQHSDGSWGLQLDDDHPLLLKDTLSSTLACVLALKTWGVGDDHVGKGLHFIGHNLSSAMDDECEMPVGFNVIFPGMLACCIDMGVEIPLTQADVDGIFRQRDKELESMASGSKAFMAYVAEGLGNLVDWNEVMVAYQRMNGSFFNSPATTAAAAIYSNNGRALQYLDSLISLFDSSVPTVYPRNLYTRLRMVDTLEKTGIDPSFSFEINYILDKTYISWLANDEEIMLDMTACAMAFRLLRMHRYDISSDGLAQFREESDFHDSIPGCLNDTEALLQLHKASQVQILKDEMILESIRSWSAKLLRQQLCSNNISRTVDPTEVEHVLKFPFYATLDRLEHRRNIEHFKTVGVQMLKSAYRACVPDEEIASLATADFHSSQSVYQEDLQYLERWVKEMRLDELKLSRVMPLTCLFAAASTMFPHELSEARIAFCKNSILVTIVDDILDGVGSMEEMENLVKLIEMWDAHDQIGFCSERVEIVFRAIYDSNNQLGAKAAAIQNRSIINHIAELWEDMARAMMAEANWAVRGHVPSLDEYMAVGEPSFGLGPIVLTTLYFIGPELHEDVVTSQDYNEMFRHMNICSRLLNDLRTCEKEKKQGKINSVMLLDLQGGSIEAATAKVRSAIEASRIELLRLVVRNESAVPWPCRQVFWKVCKVLHQFYVEVDGYASPMEMMHVANAVVHNPLQLPGREDSTRIGALHDKLVLVTDTQKCVKVNLL